MVRALRSPAWVRFVLVLVLFFQFEAFGGRSRKNRNGSRQNLPPSREISTTVGGEGGGIFSDGDERFYEGDDSNEAGDTDEEPSNEQPGGGTDDKPAPKPAPKPAEREGRMPIPAPSFAQTNGNGVVSPLVT
ncbi:MAG: hypothetical protein R3B54_11530 [Bdellovibrionota bacterium]